jgi:branched-chain amino acid aminotransferase
MIVSAYVNGQFVPADFTIPMNDLGLLRGYSVFDFCRAAHGKPFLLEKYLARFRRSATMVGLEVNETDESLTEAIARLIRESELQSAGIRLLLTGGFTPDGITPVVPNLIILLETLVEPSGEIMQTGISVMSHEYQRDMPEVKSTNYLMALKLRSAQLKQGAQDVLYYHDNQLLELTRNNFFIVRENVIITPDSRILMGITRQTVLDLARQQYRVEERPVHLPELWEADEAFSTGTNKKIVPVVRVDDRIIGDGTVGPVTKNIYNAFRAFERESVS